MKFCNLLARKKTFHFPNKTLHHYGSTENIPILLKVREFDVLDLIWFLNLKLKNKLKHFVCDLLQNCCPNLSAKVNKNPKQSVLASIWHSIQHNGFKSKISSDMDFCVFLALLPKNILSFPKVLFFLKNYCGTKFYIVISFTLTYPCIHYTLEFFTNLRRIIF